MPLLLALCLAAVPPPLPFEEASPVPRLFLQPAMDAPEGLPAGAASGSLRLLYSNSILEAADALHRLDVDLEEAHLTAELRWGVTERLELRLALRAMVDWGGLLDAPIDGVERAFGASNPARLDRARGRSRFLLTGAGGAIDRTGTGGGVGDAEAGARVALARQAGWFPALALRAAVKPPTAAPPWGSGTLDVGGGLLAGWAGARTALRLAADVTAPTGALARARLSTRPFATAAAALSWRARSGVTLHLQVSGHGAPIRASGLRELDGPDFYVLAGATVQLSRGAALELGASDGIFSPYRGADAVLLAAVRLGG